MHVDWHTPAPGEWIHSGTASFAAAALASYSCPLIEVRGGKPGPRLCVMAGVHINEASSIEAAISLARALPAEALHGSVSIIPVVSTHHLYRFTIGGPPDEGTNLHWSYPGRADGSFNEALAHALLFDWARDAAALLDLHGGDLDERMSRYVITQQTGDAAFDAHIAALARCFDTEHVLALHPQRGRAPGRCCTALASERRAALVAEAGDQGTRDSASVQWLQEGVLNVARQLGMLDDPAVLATHRRTFNRLEWISAPMSGLIDARFNPGDVVTENDRLGTVFDCFGAELAPITAPVSGVVMMKKTTQFAPQGHWIGSIGVPAPSVPVAE